MRTPSRILLTGADGFVGSHLRPILVSAFPDAALAPSTVDIRDGGTVAALIARETPDVCVHLAGISTLAAVRADEDNAWQVNLHGTLHLARAILRHAPDCLLVFASSADAYGSASGAGTSITEDTPLAPRNIYAATKAAADLALGSMVSDRLRLIRLRPFNHTGPGQSADLVVASFARQIARIAARLQPPVIEAGDLSARRDFLDVRDVCAAYVACIERSDALPPGAILNIGSGEPRRIGDVLADMLALSDVTAEVHSAPSRTRASEGDRAVLDTARARSWLGWAPTIPWLQTLRDVLNDWRARASLVAQGG